MTPTPELSAAQKKGQKLFMIGMALVMGGMIFGGGLAMVFYFLGQRPAAMAAGLLGAGFAMAGVWLQISGAKLLRSKQL